MEHVSEVIRRALPNLDDDHFTNLMSCLHGLGLRAEADLQFLATGDLKDVIPEIAIRRLMHFLKTTGRKRVVL